jgi:2-iminobutanoate/2-iminopropanoate deaminase
MITSRLAAPGDDAPFSDGVIVEGRLAFLAGQGPIRDGKIVPGSVRDQAEATMQNLADCLERLGVGTSAVVNCTCYLSDIAEISAFNAAYLEFFGTHRPARTTVQAKLISGISVEITAVVAMPGGPAEPVERSQL